MKILAILLAVQLATAAVLPDVLIEPLAECATTLTGDNGTFTSPNFPETYGSNANCSWLIITGSSTQITLRFDSFLLEAEADFVTVYDGATTASPVAGTYTGFSVPPPTHSTSNVMLVVFTSNAVLNYAGFQARYDSSAVTTTTPATTTTPSNSCGGINTGAGVIQSPNHPSNYPDNANCIWYLQSNLASGITLEFRAFETETKVDLVTIWEGWNPSSTAPVASYSGTLTAPFTFQSNSSNRLSVQFQSDDSINFPGFSAYFS